MTHLNPECKIIHKLWTKLQGHIKEELINQDISKNEKQVGIDFEKTIQGWIGTAYRTLRLTFSSQKGISGTRHEFDLITAIPRPERTRNDGLLFECKNIYLRRLLDKQMLTVKDIHLVLLKRQTIMTFLMKSYDTYPERFFDTMSLDKVYPIIISTKPCTREAFKYACVYGVTVIQPTKQTFIAFIERLSKIYGIRFDKDFCTSIENNASFYAPPQVLYSEAQMLINSLNKLDQKNPIDLLRLNARAKELDRIIRHLKREVGNLPKRGEQFLNVYEMETYRRYLDLARGVNALKEEILNKYGEKIDFSR